MRLARLAEPFDDRDWIFEIKHDGYRCVAYVSAGACDLISRNGNTFKRWPELCRKLAHTLKGHDAILDGELVCLAPDGRSLFAPLLFGQRIPCLFAFDLLWVDGDDLRDLPLLERKRRLRKLIPQRQRSRLQYLEHVARRGRDLFAAACARDLEGIVAKWARAKYTPGKRTTWAKVKNPEYSHMRDRGELMDQKPRPARMTMPRLVIAADVIAK
jgi:bifunctional non-homologous end joining protein LigD